jgi:copper chaperone CopZ
MARQFEITGMHCGGCVKRVTKALSELDPDVEVTLEPPRARFSDASLSLEAVNAKLARLGEFRAGEPKAGG